MCLHNKGFAAMLAGDPPTAPRPALDGLTTHRPEALVNRAEALPATGLVHEVRTVLTLTIALPNRCDRGSRLPATAPN